MRPKQICVFSVVVYLLLVFSLSFDLLGIYGLGSADPPTVIPSWSPTILLVMAAAGFYWIAGYHRKNSVYLKSSLMIATTMLLSAGIEFTACCWKIMYRPFLGSVILVFFLFLIYSSKLTIDVFKGKKGQSP